MIRGILLSVLLALMTFAAAAQRVEPSWVLWRAGDDRVIVDHGADTVKSMASITKLMTALVVLQLQLDPHQQLVITGREGSSRIRAGQILSRTQLLELALISSDNLAARTLAETSGMPYAQFIEQMNTTAQQLGMSHTTYTDSTGLLSTNVTTGNDLRLLLAEVSKHQLFNHSAITPDIKVSVPAKRTFKDIVAINTNWLIGKLDILAAKTGTTNAAGRCFAMLFTLREQKYVLVVLGARDVRERRKLVQQLIDDIE